MSLELYIKVDENGNAVGHPYLFENLRDHFPDGIPQDQYQPFLRVAKPVHNIFQNVNEQPVYKKVDGVWQDVWEITSKTNDEITQIKADIDQIVFNIKTTTVDAVNALMADPLTTDAQKTVYTNYLAQVQSYVVTDYLNWEVPPIPQINLNGNTTP
jgi:Tfp pilus tip-associated adhesin PilY1